MSAKNHMRKPASAEYDIHELFVERWSPRAFDSRPVEDEKLLTLFEAARWAASTFNRQPWRFIVARQTEPEAFAQLLACLTESNQRWAKHAPVLLLTVAELHWDDGKPIRHALHDVGMALAHLMLQAAALGLHAHPMAGFSVEQARATYQIPDGYEPLTAVAIGYYGSIDQLIDRDQVKEHAPRTRKPLHEVLFSGTWGQPASFIPQAK
jgi:nitroreductase